MRRECRQDRRKQHEFQHPAAFDLPEQDQSNRHPERGPHRYIVFSNPDSATEMPSETATLSKIPLKIKAVMARTKAHQTEDQQR